ncbi:hypothetical protein [Polyangium sorediatum]|uniref:PE-PGRS family protein n=1 Tax=Polyangium sorediatum TaxID=889274 RepID=A0ABT6NNN1_9BACT|nr:hypothetical protein [Polyangium sorediatum]MDI1429940.1 hypothetical protein [Polyangium sorediatum]
MRFVLLAQVAGAALFLAGCPGDQQVEPTGGATGCPAGQVCPPGTGGGGGNGGDGGDGAGGSGNGTAQGGSGQGGNGAGGAGAGNGSGGAGGNGSGGAGGNGSGGAGAGGSGGSGGNAAVCEPLKADVDLKLVEATKCYPLQPEIAQCQEIIAGPCCPISVLAQDLPEVVAYKEALNKYENADCDAACPPIPCPAMPQFKCTANENDPTTGACTPVTP